MITVAAFIVVVLVKKFLGKSYSKEFKSFSFNGKVWESSLTQSSGCDLSLFLLNSALDIVLLSHEIEKRCFCLVLDLRLIIESVINARRNIVFIIKRKNVYRFVM